MTKLLEQAIEELRKLPDSRQDEVAQRLLGVLAESDEEPIELDEDTRAAVEEGLAQADRGEIISQEEMEVFFRRLGV
jgi:predicted transcriptional regulator